MTVTAPLIAAMVVEELIDGDVALLDEDSHEGTFFLPRAQYEIRPTPQGPVLEHMAPVMWADEPTREGLIWMINVQGYCPHGCGRTLFLGDGGHITCSLIGCPDPSAVDTILDEDQPMHVVTLRDDTFTIRHPLRERIGTDLEDCGLHTYLAALDGPPRKPGRYIALEIPANTGRWAWREIKAPAGETR